MHSCHSPGYGEKHALYDGVFKSNIWWVSHAWGTHSRFRLVHRSQARSRSRKEDRSNERKKRKARKSKVRQGKTRQNKARQGNAHRHGDCA